MKKVIFLMLIVAFCTTTSSTYGSGIEDWLKGPKKSKSFKKVRKTYEKQMTWFFKEVFRQAQTGPMMDTTMRTALENKIYEQMLKDYWCWGKFTRKHETKKKFELSLKKTKKYETESAEYISQFKKLQTGFVQERLIIDSDQLSKILTKEKLQPYIDGVMKKFETRTTATFQKLKP